MNVFEQWLLDTSRALIKPSVDDYLNGEPLNWELLEKRLAIALVQARALECRQISASMLIHRPPTLKELANGLTDRSTRLERLGIQMAEPDGWPPSNEPKEDATVEPGPRLIIQ